jgi:plasmid maintenance system antidote protein VapI
MKTDIPHCELLKKAITESQYLDVSMVALILEKPYSYVSNTLNFRRKMTVEDALNFEIIFKIDALKLVKMQSDYLLSQLPPISDERKKAMSLRKEIALARVAKDKLKEIDALRKLISESEKRIEVLESE